MSNSFAVRLMDLLKSRATASGWEWMTKSLESLSVSVKEATLLAAYTAATRQLGKQELNLPEFVGWRLDDLGRLILLLNLPQNSFEVLAVACYEAGDSSEQASWLRGLSLLPNCEHCLPMAIDACRTNVLPLFEAISCENPFPSRYFPELNFNQMVLKCLFNGISLSRIVGLEGRFNEELSRMANDYVSEREAAGREVPVDIWLTIAPKIQGDGLVRVRHYLESENPQHRHWAAVGLSHRKD